MNWYELKENFTTKAYTPFSDVDFTKEFAEKYLFFFFSDLHVGFATGSILYGTKSPVADTKLSSEASDKQCESSPQETCVLSSSDLDIFLLISLDTKDSKILLMRIWRHDEISRWKIVGSYGTRSSNGGRKNRDFSPRNCVVKSISDALF